MPYNIAIICNIMYDLIVINIIEKYRPKFKIHLVFT